MKAALRLPTRWATTSGRLGSPVRNPGKTIQTPNKSPTHFSRSEEHTSELQSLTNLVCRLLLEKNNCDPGGTINLVTKKPLPQQEGEINIGGGTWDHYRLTFFFTDPATTKISSFSLHNALPV